MKKSDKELDEINRVLMAIYTIRDAINQIKQTLDRDNVEDMAFASKLRDIDIAMQMLYSYLLGDIRTCVTLRMLIVCENKVNYTYEWISKFVATFNWKAGKYYFTWDLYRKYRKFLKDVLPADEYPKELFPKLHIQSVGFILYYLSFACILRRVMNISRYRFRRGRMTHPDGRYRRGYYVYPYQRRIAGRYKDDENIDHIISRRDEISENINDFMEYILAEEIPHVIRNYYPDLIELLEQESKEDPETEPVT